MSKIIHLNVFDEIEIVNTSSNNEDANWLRSVNVKLEEKRNKFFTTLFIGKEKDCTTSGTLEMAIDAVDDLFYRHQLGDEKADKIKKEFSKFNN